MQTVTINNFKVQIFNTFNGTELYIMDAENNQVYAHKVSGDPIQRANEVISQF